MQKKYKGYTTKVGDTGIKVQLRANSATDDIHAWVTAPDRTVQENFEGEWSTIKPLEQDLIDKLSALRKDFESSLVTKINAGMKAAGYPEDSAIKWSSNDSGTPYIHIHSDRRKVSVGETKGLEENYEQIAAIVRTATDATKQEFAAMIAELSKRVNAAKEEARGR